MSETVDDIMARCPLKQEIRQSLWGKFARQVSGGKRLASYLTLYSPPMMDIKHLHRCNLLDFDGESFRGVIAVTYNREHYAAAMRRSSGRPELLLCGNINDLITQGNTDDAKRLRKCFPVQVINLDYTNSLFGQANSQPISDHLAAVDEVIRLQHKKRAQEFALFITTRAERSEQPDRDQFSEEFLADLARRVTENLKENARFQRSYRKVFGEMESTSLLLHNYKAFVPIGLSKLISQVLAQHSFELITVDGRVLVRDRRSPIRWLLHLALRVRAGVAPRARSLRACPKSQLYAAAREK